MNKRVGKLFNHPIVIGDPNTVPEGAIYVDIDETTGGIKSIKERKKNAEELTDVIQGGGSNKQVIHKLSGVALYMLSYGPSSGYVVEYKVDLIPGKIDLSNYKPPTGKSVEWVILSDKVKVGDRTPYQNYKYFPEFTMSSNAEVLSQDGYTMIGVQNINPPATNNSLTVKFPYMVITVYSDFSYEKCELISN